jgi:hypothetical protein
LSELGFLWGTAEIEHAGVWQIIGLAKKKKNLLTF